MDEYTAIRGLMVSNPKEADVECWGVPKAKSPFQKYYYKFPEILEPNEVQVKIMYSSVCHTDWAIANADWDPPQYFPLIPGHEIVGKVTKLGKNVTTHKLGDIVGVGPYGNLCQNCKYCKMGLNTMCGGCKWTATSDLHIGGFSTYTNIHSALAYLLPASMDISSAAPLMCAGATVFAPLKLYGKPGYRCAIFGVGGLGHLAVQFAHKMGMKVVACDIDKGKVAESKALGADEFVISSSKESLAELRKDKVDLAINTTYIPDPSGFFECVKPFGTMAQIGIAPTKVPIRINPADLVRDHKKLVGSLYATMPQLKEMLQFAADNKVRPIAKHFTWEELPKAIEETAKGMAHYRNIVDVSVG